VILLASSERSEAACVFAIFGVGLIGSALVDSLTSSRRVTRSELPLSWANPAARGRQLDRVATRTLEALRSFPGAGLRVVWAAGHAGFGSTDDDTRLEIDAFQDVTDGIRSIAARSPSTPITFAVASSAGGLFEGQRVVEAGSQPSPRRPYGHLKLHQETLVQAEGAPWAARIFRLTSVYGFIRPGHRMGLVTTLVRNGFRQERTIITGRMDTLRDFIWVEDVANYLAATLSDPEQASRPAVNVLASCKPSTLAEVEQLVNQTLGRRVYASYSLVPSNEVDITFRRDVVPAGFESSDLRSNVIRIHKDALRSGLALVRESARANGKVA